MNLRSVDLNLLVVFEAVLAEGNATRAARRLGMSQPAVSEALSRLRHLLKDELFVRTPGGMRPTRQALELAGPLADALGRIRQTLAAGAAFEPATAERVFRIGSQDYTEFVILPVLNDRLRRHAPGVGIRMIGVTERSAVEKLDRDEIDLAILAFTGPLPKRLRMAGLLHERAACLTRRGHPALVAGMTRERYASLPHIAQSLSGETGDTNVDRTLAGLGAKRRVAVTVTNFLALPYVIGTTDLVATQPERVARRLAAVADLAVHEPPVPIADWRISMAWGPGAASDPGVAWLRATLTELCRSL